MYSLNTHAAGNIYLCAVNEPSVSMYTTLESIPPYFIGKQPITVNIIQNCVLPHPDGPVIFR